MKSKRVLGISIALLFLLVWAAGSTSLLAAPASGLSVGFQVNPDGSWKVVELFGQPIDLDPQSFNSVARILGLQFELPAQLIDPAVVRLLSQADIAQVTMALEGDAARLWLNDRQLPQAKVHIQALQPLLPEPYGQPFNFLTQILRFVPGTFYVRFTPQPLAAPSAQPVPVAAQPVNALHLAATVDPQGHLLSAAGFTHQDVDPFLSAAGLVIPDLDPGVAALLARFDKLALDLTPGEAMLLTNDQTLLELFWDADSRQYLLDTAQRLGGFQLDPQILDLAETWLQTTHATADLFIATSPQDDLPQIALGEPITVALADTGLLVAGAPIPVAGLDTALLRQTIQAYGIQQAQLCWQDNQLRWLVNGLPMPYLTADTGWLTKLIRLTGWQPLPMADKLDQLLAQTDLPITLLASPSAAAQAPACEPYQVASAPAPSLAFAVAGTWNRQQAELALEDVEIPFQALGMLPIDITAQLRFPPIVAAFVPSAVNHVQASLGAGGATATVDDVNIAIHWDQTLLSNLAQVADAFGVGATIRQLSPVLSVAGIDVNVESVETVAGAAEGTQ